MSEENENLNKGYIDALAESALLENPLKDALGSAARVGKRVAKRAGAAAASTLGFKQGDAALDAMDTTAKLRNHFIRYAGNLEGGRTMQNLASFLLDYYGTQIDTTTGRVIKDVMDGSEPDEQPNTQGPLNFTDPEPSNPGETAPEAEPQATPEEPATTTTQNPTQVFQRRIALELLSNQPDYRKVVEHLRGLLKYIIPNGSKEELLTTARWLGSFVEDRALLTKLPQLAQIGPEIIKRLNDKAKSFDVETPDTQVDEPSAAPSVDTKTLELRQAFVREIIKPSPNKVEVMRAIRDLIKIGRASNDAQEKKKIAQWLKSMTKETEWNNKVPELAMVSDEVIKRVMENISAAANCASYLVENDIQGARGISDILDLFYIFEAFRPNSKLKMDDIDRILTGVAKHLLSQGLVDFGDRDKRAVFPSPQHRGSADGHVRGAAGAGTYAPRQPSPAAPTAAPGGSTPPPGDPAPNAEAPPQSAAGEQPAAGTESDDINAKLDIHEFEDTLTRDFGFTVSEVEAIFDDAHHYRDDARRLYATFDTAEKKELALKIAAAAMVSILVNSK